MNPPAAAQRQTRGFWAQIDLPTVPYAMVVDHDDVAPSVGLGFAGFFGGILVVCGSWHLSSLCKRHVTYGISVKIRVKIYVSTDFV